MRGEDAEKHGEKGARWKLDADDNQRGVWFSCSYGQWNVLLSRKVKNPVTVCWSPDSVPAKLGCK
ncbi:STY0301 family protein [Citrobacter farmeri]|uniref:STY0301 family protein n=1 Tax=Citrobacter farmeri TaxID=67824 RepID=UPI002A35A7DD|nr:STY0301 family protein [Citrobacter farmeri]